MERAGRGRRCVPLFGLRIWKGFEKILKNAKKSLAFLWKVC
jgi:hypothetical protein